MITGNCRHMAQKLGIHYENIVSVTSDSARYMGKCISAIRTLVSEAHKPNLVGNILAVELSDLNNCVIQTKHLFMNTRKRKHSYIQFLAEKYVHENGKAKLLPIPVITRWNTLGSQVVKEESVGMNYFKALTLCEVKKIHCQAVMLVVHCAQCCNHLA
ncbi:hypothetical protein PR048_003725 [Dryococelus australis]|uniref:Uncharacterized protein n=1 Tax=Dryococelus australis TaxID=614101 RepID=A0ABQ9INY7_9NEOP|nr:hypothetical protein PR048_003725 [Dryococelus australis]